MKRVRKYRLRNAPPPPPEAEKQQIATPPNHQKQQMQNQYQQNITIYYNSTSTSRAQFITTVELESQSQNSHHQPCSSRPPFGIFINIRSTKILTPRENDSTGEEQPLLMFYWRTIAGERESERGQQRQRMERRKPAKHEEDRTSHSFRNSYFIRKRDTLTLQIRMILGLVPFNLNKHHSLIDMLTYSLDCLQLQKLQMKWCMLIFINLLHFLFQF